MIAVDTSALMAILLDEPDADRCMAALETDEEILISSGTMAEALIVAGRRGVGEEMERLIDGLGATILDLTPADARGIARAYAQWGKGMHPAALNFGDCFAYEAARARGCPLLYVGEDFARTDLAGVP